MIIVAIISAIVAAVSALIAALAYHYNKTIFSIQALNDLVEKYSDEKMGIAIRSLWTYYIKDCERKENKLIQKYIEDYNNKNAIHDTRRKVSLFYQQFAFLFAMRIIRKNKIMKLWSQESLKIIPEILVPIETKALNEAVTGAVREIEKPYVNLMIKLYNAMGNNKY